MTTTASAVTRSAVPSGSAGPIGGVAMLDREDAGQVVAVAPADDVRLDRVLRRESPVRERGTVEHPPLDADRAARLEPGQVGGAALRHVDPELVALAGADSIVFVLPVSETPPTVEASRQCLRSRCSGFRQCGAKTVGSVVL